MTPLQAKYVENRIAGLRPKQAAIAAGYAAKGADAAACALEARADVQKAIKKKEKPEVTKPQNAGGRRGNRPMDAETVRESDPNAGSYLRKHYDSPLELLTHVMNEPRAPDGLRVQCAKDAAPYIHGKVAPEQKKGKKEHQADLAREKSRSGKFASRAAPRGRPTVN